MAEKIFIPFYLPGWLYRPLRKLKGALASPASRINIDGERHVEWSFLSTEMPDTPGEALDFGCECGYISLLAAKKGFHTIASDLQQQHFPWEHPNVEFLLGDFLELDLPPNHFDLLINCSSIEHVGVAGRYGVTANRNNGDIDVMEKFERILKPGGKLLMTVPCGQDTIMAPWCRVYGSERLPRLLAPLHLEKDRYWVKDGFNRWIEARREEALSFKPHHDPSDPLGCSYALGGFVLRKVSSASPIGYRLSGGRKSEIKNQMSDP